jgi:hypothetical protein
MFAYTGVDERAAAWLGLTSEEVEPIASLKGDGTELSCCREFGRGFCRARRDAGEIAGVRSVMTMLRQTTRFEDAIGYRPAWCPIRLPLFLFTPINAEPDVEAVMYLRIARFLSPVLPMFLQCEWDGPVQPGVEVKPILDVGSRYCGNLSKLARMLLARAPAHKVEIVDYKFTALNVLEILSVRDMSDDPMPATRAKKDPVIQEVNKILGEIRGKASGSAAGSAPRAPRGGGSSGSGGGAPGPGGGAAVLGNPGPGAALPEAPPGPPDAPAGIEGSHELPVGADAIAGAEVEDILRDAGMPVYDGETHQVHSARHPQIILGRIKPVHPGSAKECISVYCRRHGCTPPLTRSSQGMSLVRMVEWFRDGEDIEFGKAHRAEHMKRWHELLAA